MQNIRLRTFINEQVTQIMFPKLSLDLVILSILDNFPDGITGYALVEEFKKRFGKERALSPGTLYPRLTKLKADNFIEDDGKVWKIREEGKQRLETNVPDVLSKSFEFMPMLYKFLMKTLPFPRRMDFMCHPMNEGDKMMCNPQPDLFDAESIIVDLDLIPDEGKAIPRLEEIKQQLDRTKKAIEKRLRDQVETIDTLLSKIDEKIQRCNEEKSSWKRITVEEGTFDEH
jgi:DNA-binding PadR family transcriptional regulator